MTQFLTKANSVKPWIFCSDEAATLQSWDQPIKDRNNKEIPSTVVDGEVKDYFTLKQVFPAQFSIPNHKAYFLKAFNGYDFYNIKGDTICADKTRYATTSRFRDHADRNPLVSQVDITPATRHVVFCPPTFNPETDRHHSFRTLAGTVSSGNYPPIKGDWTKPQPSMEHYLTVSGTLFHELYHLTDTGDTKDPYSKSYFLRYSTTQFIADYLLSCEENMITIYKAAKVQAKDNANNPESYLYMATATYLYLNLPQGKEAVLFPAGSPKRASEVR